MDSVEEGMEKPLTQAKSTTRPAVLSSQFHARLFLGSSKLVIFAVPPHDLLLFHQSVNQCIIIIEHRASSTRSAS